MRLRERVFHRAMQRADDDVGEPREGRAGLLGRHRARQDAGADQEHVLLAEQPQPVEEVLVGCPPRRACARARLRAWPRPAARRRTPGRAAHPSPRDGARGCRTSRRRGAERQRDQRDEVGVLLEQREQPAADLQSRQEAIERGDGGVRILRASRAGRAVPARGRHELAAGKFATQRGIGAGEPAPHRRRDFERLAEAHRAQPVERFAIVGILRERQGMAIARRRPTSSNSRA